MTIKLFRKLNYIVENREGLKGDKGDTGLQGIQGLKGERIRLDIENDSFVRGTFTAKRYFYSDFFSFIRAFLRCLLNK